MKRCPYCAEEIQDAAIVCKHCGRDLRVKKLDVQTEPAKPKRKSRLRNYILVGVVAILLLCIATIALPSSPDSKPPTDSTVAEKTAGKEEPIPTEIPKPTNTAIPRPTATLAPLSPTFKEIEEKVESMTEAQWKNYLPTLKGLRIENWTGWVVDVDKGIISGYTLWVDMDPPGALSVQDIYIPINEDVALEFQKGQKVTFSGIIKNVTELLGSISINLEQGAIVE